MKFQELSGHSAEELRTLLKEERQRLEQLRFRVAGGTHKGVRELRAARLQIARILTALNRSAAGRTASTPVAPAKPLAK